MVGLITRSPNRGSRYLRISANPLAGARRSYFFHSANRTREKLVDDKYIQYPVVTAEQMKKICIEKFKFEFAFSSYAFHSSSSSFIHSLSDLTDQTDLTSLLPRRRPPMSPADTLSISAGDDAMLVSPTTIAIADGVSGWEDKGINCSSSIWSRSMLETLSRLLTEYKISHIPHHLNKRDIDEVLDDSFLHTSHLMDLRGLNGSSTLILAMLSDEYLKMISIGDSKLYIIRDGEIIKTNEEQMISPLCPKQIGTQTLGVLPSEMAWVDSIKLREGDIMVMCSDGISDNLYDYEILHYVDEYIALKKDSLNALAHKLLIKAKEVGFDDYIYTPYNEKVNKTTQQYGTEEIVGGKLDDMSVCVARVILNKDNK